MRRSALVCVGCAPGRPSRDCSSDCSLRFPDTWAYLSVGAAFLNGTPNRVSILARADATDRPCPSGVV